MDIRPNRYEWIVVDRSGRLRWSCFLGWWHGHIRPPNHHPRRLVVPQVALPPITASRIKPRDGSLSLAHTVTGEAVNFSGMLKEVTVILFLGMAVWAYQATQPPPPKICGTLDGPPITAPRMKLRDGRHLSYMEHGVSKETANAKIILVHGFASTKHDMMSVTEPVLDVVEELRLYFVSFDRPGYGESDPDPRRTPTSLALDIEELADHLGLGYKFMWWDSPWEAKWFGAASSTSLIATLQGVFESLHRDLMIGFGKWEFDPMDLENPFPNNESSVHLWQGDEDIMVPSSLQRYIAQRLPWIDYHEVPGAGHLFTAIPQNLGQILKVPFLGRD
ncbi:hypothetical protein NC652_026802 [Populus alba x Populus x berolinensis]|nr:hypothetical protein NC652_026802 [Populus alba x Populus x berolinensis]